MVAYDIHTSAFLAQLEVYEKSFVFLDEVCFRARNF